MKLTKRCYGCGGIIWPWQEAINTEKVGLVHKNRSCILDAWYKLLGREAKRSESDPLLSEALSGLLGVKE